MNDIEKLNRVSKMLNEAIRRCNDGIKVNEKALCSELRIDSIIFETAVVNGLFKKKTNGYYQSMIEKASPKICKDLIESIDSAKELFEKAELQQLTESFFELRNVDRSNTDIFPCLAISLSNRNYAKLCIIECNEHVANVYYEHHCEDGLEPQWIDDEFKFICRSPEFNVDNIRGDRSFWELGLMDIVNSVFDEEMIETINKARRAYNHFNSLSLQTQQNCFKHLFEAK